MTVPGEPLGKLGDVVEWGAIAVMMGVSLLIPAAFWLWVIPIIRELLP